PSLPGTSFTSNQPARDTARYSPTVRCWVTTSPLPLMVLPHWAFDTVARARARTNVIVLFIMRLFVLFGSCCCSFPGKAHPAVIAGDAHAISAVFLPVVALVMALGGFDTADIELKILQTPDIRIFGAYLKVEMVLGMVTDLYPGIVGADLHIARIGGQLVDFQGAIVPIDGNIPMDLPKFDPDIVPTAQDVPHIFHLQAAVITGVLQIPHFQDGHIGIVGPDVEVPGLLHGETGIVGHDLGGVDIAEGGAGGIVKFDLVVAPMELPDLQFAVIALYLGMPIDPVQKDTTVVVAQVYTVLHGQLDGIVHLHAHLVPPAPGPVPSPVVVPQTGGGRDHGGIVLEIHPDFLQAFLDPLLVVAVGLDVHLDLHPVLVPGGQGQVAITVDHLQKGVGVD